MARFLLIHGASHGAWCWEKVLPLLAERGHEASAIDLPGHGADPTPPGRVRMADYVGAILSRLEPETILVGHSLGGIPITLAGAQAPDRVRALVYLCALVPRPGEAFVAFRREAINPDLNDAQEVDREAGVTRAIRERSGPLFYSDCNRDDRAWALDRLTPQPIAVMTEPAEFAWPDVPRHYIRCTEDRVVFPDYQRDVSRDWDSAFDMATGHSPFLSAPDELAEILDEIAA